MPFNQVDTPVQEITLMYLSPPICISTQRLYRVGMDGIVSGILHVHINMWVYTYHRIIYIYYILY